VDYLALISALIWIVTLLLPWRPWSVREQLDGRAGGSEPDLGDVTVLIPARNEAETIGRTLAGVVAQGSGLTIVLVDDQSTDATGEEARKAAGERVRIVSGEPLPSGWSGKLWALEQGRRHITTPLTLLIDADIELKPGILVALRDLMKQSGRQFVSLMAELRMQSFWERLLMPAFVYFFKLLYPFGLSNSRWPFVAAAAGGCILVETRVLEEIGGFKALRGELIDDCALARRVKSGGCGTWIGLTHSVRSIRSYNDLGSIADMVARTAFTQLRYSVFLLMVCTAALLLAFWAPVFVFVFGDILNKFLSIIAFLAMILCYAPTLRYYSISLWWALTLPATGAIYLGMTWMSAIRYWRGKRSQWKGRVYSKA
jgi:hopene-associated glycosyltransferase HpnB